MRGEPSSVETITPQELHARLRGGVAVFDANPPRSWRRARVPGATCLDPAAYAATELPTDKDAPLVFYCSDPSCGAAPRAARRALQLGHRDVRVMSAGIRGWIEAGLPTESGS